jgi:hypothetical protein
MAGACAAEEQRGYVCWYHFRLWTLGRIKWFRYGKGKADVMRRFIESAMVSALEAGAIQRRGIRDLNETPDNEED